jgi:hypothetical protein
MNRVPLPSKSSQKNSRLVLIVELPSGAGVKLAYA